MLTPAEIDGVSQALNLNKAHLNSAVFPVSIMKRKCVQSAPSAKRKQTNSPPNRGLPQDEWPSSAQRCWSSDDLDMQPYHDSTWGRPETDECQLFRSQTLQLMQCGVSWTTVCVASFTQCFFVIL